jgi:drug/metabolite transporter (DMT)-like permease
MVISFFGVLIMIYYSNTQSVGSTARTQYVLGIILNIIAAVFLSIINVIIRKLNDVHYSVTAGFQSMGNLAFSVIAMLLFRLSYATIPLSITIKDVLMLTANGLVQTFA